MADKPIGPLEGIRVCDLTHALSGPYCTMMLGDMGAEVVKIEMPGRGDESRHWGPPFLGDQSTYFLCCNRNKKGLTLDLKSEAGKEVFRKLVENSDVLVENFAPGVMERLGFSYGEMKKINPGLVYCSISGFGQDGPKKLYTAYDIIVQGMSGVMSLTGQDDGPPTQVGIPITDIVAGMHSAFAISNALLYKSKTGEGQYIDTSMIGGALSILVSHGSSYFATGKVPGVQGTQHGMIAPYGTFQTGSGRINIAVGNDMIWDRFCEAVGMEEYRQDPRFSDNFKRVTNKWELKAIIDEHLSKYTPEQALKVLGKAKIPCGPINDLGQAFADPQVAFLDLFQQVDHPTAGKIGQVGVPYKMSETPGGIRFAPPLLGQHTDEVLRTLGYSDEEITALHEEKAV